MIYKVSCPNTKIQTVFTSSISLAEWPYQPQSALLLKRQPGHLARRWLDWLEYFRLGDILFLTVEARGNLIPGLQYRILVKTPEGKTEVFTYTPGNKLIPGRSFLAQLDLAQLGNPPVVAFSADVQRQFLIERTGWYFLEFEDWVN
jgi:hypothetical protein